MLDGMALGESTPGPLIMVVVYVAFLGGVRGVPAGAEYATLCGLGAAVVTVWFTFLPSFVFILAGGPLVESVRHLRSLTEPLNAMRAATVGAMVQLALVLAGHVLWPAGFGRPPEWRPCVIVCGAAAALFGFKRGVLEVIGWSALAGFLLSYVAW
jgi:chromate transporter